MTVAGAPPAPGPVVDFHTHVVPRSIERQAAQGRDLPHLLVESAGKGCFCCAGAKPRPLDDRSWDVGRRHADMDADGVAGQVVSPMPMTFGYGLDRDDARDFHTAQNDGIAEMVAASGGRFAGLCGVPLQDVDLACRELERAMTSLGLRGVEIGAQVGGVDLDDPQFEPFWRRCAELDAVVFIHPEGAPGPRLSGRLEPLVGYPLETGIAAAKLMAAGLFSRHPGLKVVLAHGGGALPWLLPRLDQGWSRFADMRETWSAKPSELARRFYYDTLTFDPANLQLLIDRLGADRLVIGSDYPFTLMEAPPGRVLDELVELDPGAKTAIRSATARALAGRIGEG